MWLMFEPSLIPDILIPIMVYLPLALAAVVLLISYQFNLFRLFSLSVVFSLWFLLTYFQGASGSFQTPTYALWFSWLLPIIIVALSWAPERGILTIYGMGTWVLLAGVVILSHYVIDTSQYAQVIDARLNLGPSVPLMPLGILIGAMVQQLFRLLRYDNVLDGVLLSILVVIGWFLFTQPQTGVAPFIAMSLIQVLLIWGLIKHSHDMAYRDELTGLPGRRALNEWLKAPGRQYVIAMLDIDHFKKFNDRYGHDVGDDVLKIVASRLAKVTGGGKAFRYGGEEFTIIFTGKEIHQCTPHLEAVREDIAHYKISLREKAKRPKSKAQGKQQRGKGSTGRKISVTISIGVATRQPERNAEAVIKVADKMLYKAKKAGRNCLVAEKSN
jgi:diguanylate cyclase (GGDEF)-like protein